MSVYTTDQQQIEQFHQWWKLHGTSTILMIVFALALGFGWRFWLQYHEGTLSQASSDYEQLLNSVVNNDSTNAITMANTLTQEYSRTPYAPLAALMLARQSVNQGNLNDAENRLVWVTHHTHNKALRQVARLRAARVLLAENQPQQALNILNEVDDKAYMPSIEEVTGDSYAALGEFALARQAYLKATQILPGYDVAQPILRMKLDELSATNATSASSNATSTSTSTTGSNAQTTTGANHE